MRHVQRTASGVPHDKAALAHALHGACRGKLRVIPNGPRT